MILMGKFMADTFLSLYSSVCGCGWCGMEVPKHFQSSTLIRSHHFPMNYYYTGIVLSPGWRKKHKDLEF